MSVEWLIIMGYVVGFFASLFGYTVYCKARGTPLIRDDMGDFIFFVILWFISLPLMLIVVPLAILIYWLMEKVLSLFDGATTTVAEWISHRKEAK